MYLFFLSKYAISEQRDIFSSHELNKKNCLGTKHPFLHGEYQFRKKSKFGAKVMIMLVYLKEQFSIVEFSAVECSSKEQSVWFSRTE